MKRFWSLLLVLLLIPCLAVAASAEETSGKCGENLTWVYEDTTGTLTISGTGNMDNFLKATEEDGETYYWASTPWYRDELLKVILEEGVASVGEGAFYRAEDLCEVVFADSVVSVGSMAFAECDRLRVTLPGNDRLQIADGAFSGTEITTLEIPAKLTGAAADEISKLSANTYLVAEDHPVFSLCDGILFNKDQTVLIAVPNTYKFENNHYTVPDTVTTISDMAFWGIRNLHSITFPASVQRIGADAFEQAWYISSVYITDLEKWLGITFENLNANPLHEGADLFVNGKKLENLVIPEGTVSIGDYVFSGLKYSGNITIPASVTSIGTGAFKLNGKTFGSVYITDLSAWSKIRFASQTSNPLFRAEKLYVNGKPLTKLVLPEGTTSVGDYVFNSCKGLTEVTIPNTVTSVGKGAFGLCIDLTKVSMPDSVTYIGEGAFEQCAWLEAIHIPSKLTAINDSVFSYCESLVSVTLPETVKSIGAGAFEMCSNLTSINLPKKLTSIGANAFYRCRKLTSMTIPDSVTGIGGFAFSMCTGLREMNLGTGLKELGNGVFYECKRIRKLTIPGAVGTIGDYFAQGCISLESVTLGEGITTINAEAFSGCVKLKSVTFPGTIEGIFIDSFEYCPVLTEFYLDDLQTWLSLEFLFMDGREEGEDFLNSNRKYKYILDVNQNPKNLYIQGEKLTDVDLTREKHWLAEHAFHSTTIEHVNMTGFDSIYYHMFSDCDSLESVSLYGGMERIGASAFSGCDNLKTLTVSSSLKEVLTDAFAGCTNLSKVNYGGSEAERKEISIGTGNTGLEKASWEYNCNLELMPPVISITGVSSTGKPKVTWTAVEGAERYRVYRSTSKSGSYSYLGYTTGLSYTDKTAKTGTQYYYKVKSYDTDTKSVSIQYSNIVNRVCDLKKPTVTLKVDTASGKPKVTFEKISGADKYYIVRSTSEKGTYSKLATTTSTSYIDKTAKAGKTYYYKVKALHAKDAADSAYSAVTSRVCDLKKPLVTIFLKEGDPRIKWDAITGAVKYQVYRATSRNGEYTLVKTTKTSTSYTDTAAKAGKTYYYKVRAIHENPDANSAYSAVKYIKAK